MLGKAIRLKEALQAGHKKWWSKRRRPKTTSRKTIIIERLEIVEHFGNESSVFDELRKKGYRITHSGPYTNKTMFPKVDPDRFMLTAERELQNRG